MAEIRVEPQRSGKGWLWLLILLLIVAALVWYFMSRGGTANTGAVDSTGGATTSAPARTP
jgi:hypothetical protein